MRSLRFFLFAFFLSFALQTHGQSYVLPGVGPPELKEELEAPTLGISFSSEVFNEIFDPMYFTAISYKQPTKYGSLIARAHLNNRFSSWGSQFEVDFYPKIVEGTYAYVNYGFSGDDIFPNHRVGSELYHNFSKGWEASAGLRWLQFEDDNTTIFTGSVGLYKGNWYFTLRPYITPQGSEGTSTTLAISARRYLKTAKHYWGITFSAGSSPEIQRTANGIVLNDIDTQNFSFNTQIPYKDKGHLNFSLGLSRQEMAFDPGNYFLSFNGGVSYLLGI